MKSNLDENGNLPLPKPTIDNEFVGVWINGEQVEGVTAVTIDFGEPIPKGGWVDRG